MLLQHIGLRKPFGLLPSRESRLIGRKWEGLCKDFLRGLYWRGRKWRLEDLRNPKRHHHVEKLRLVFGYFSSVVSAGIQVRLVGLNDDAWAEIMKRRVLPMSWWFLSSAKHLFRSTTGEN